MLLRVAVVVNPEVTPNALQEHTGKSRRQTRMFIFTEGQGRREIHESARGCLHAEKHLRAVRLFFALAPFMRVRAKRSSVRRRNFAGSPAHGSQSDEFAIPSSTRIVAKRAEPASLPNDEW